MTTTAGRPEVDVDADKEWRVISSRFSGNIPAIFWRNPWIIVAIFWSAFPHVWCRRRRGREGDFPAIFWRRDLCISSIRDDDGHDEEGPPSAARASLSLTTAAGVGDELTGAGEDRGAVKPEF
ncbi:hypothetical protein TIFTF001_030222 [Ficus carica]|uniref:Uncharacterized protein n=1 Tax=Ficus carica TaxID=3494 RepID=A0AA88J3V0_FICCA|nr:hypothetical protein TIFTF001_030222 [Ficus carica]